MATPHVAGVVALLLQAKPGATAQELRKVILDSSKPIGGEPALRYGRGMIQPLEALKLLTGVQVTVGTAKPRARAVKSRRARKG